VLDLQYLCKGLLDRRDLRVAQDLRACPDRDELAFQLTVTIDEDVPVAVGALQTLNLLHHRYRRAYVGNVVSKAETSQCCIGGRACTFRSALRFHNLIDRDGKPNDG